MATPQESEHGVESSKTKMEEKYHPTPPTLKPNVFTIHLIRVPRESDDQREWKADAVQQLVLEEYPLLLPHMKRGDAVEDLEVGGYRSSGIYFVEHVDAASGTLELMDRSKEVDEYGNQPMHYTTLDQYPPDYFAPQNAQTNNMYCPDVPKSPLYWHTNEGWNLFSVALADQIVADPDSNGNKGTLEYNGETYHFKNLIEAKLDNNQLVTCHYNAATKTFLGGFC
eukprot:CAMPEP_0172465732 /NCGR_PEP_ID=MMETSP1065-20121228/54405_1 /TAXON_ID=265537 /ORGANISM="Amphiprora paludosa, Strain CCMP125" /LENGTH=224 /DNA_ID=CAMNT_0013222353 /DNA_START=267 /DNA_END=941 /DNA_ORIENTATION=-